MASIATGEIATEEMKEDIIDIKERGKIARNEFISRFTKDGSKQSYYDPIKQQPVKLFEKKTDKTKNSITIDECQSFTEIFARFNQKTLDLRQIMEWPLTSEPWSIINEDEKSRANRKHVFRNNLQDISPVPRTCKIPNNISTTIIDVMRVLRMIPIAGIKHRTFKSWADAIMRFKFNAR